MRNLSTSKVVGVEKIILKIPFRKLLTLNNILYILDIMKNLMCSSLLSKNSLNIVFESHKFILSKNNVFVEKRNLSDDLFNMNAMTIITNYMNNNKNNVFF
jgi:hypothetical protein